jgi:hypothetical protein
MQQSKEKTDMEENQDILFGKWHELKGQVHRLAIFEMKIATVTVMNKI